MEGRRGEKSREVKVYDLEQRQLIDAEITRRSIAVMERQTQARKPFFAYVALTLPHLQTLTNPAFTGKTGNGDWADMLAEMDHHVGQMLDAVDRSGILDNTIIILARDRQDREVSPRRDTALYDRIPYAVFSGCRAQCSLARGGL